MAQCKNCGERISRFSRNRLCDVCAYQKMLDYATSGVPVDDLKEVEEKRAKAERVKK